jgi:protein-disulfide isomerase
MAKRVAILAILATACAASNQHLETRVDNLTTELDKMRREIEQLRHTLETELARSRPDPQAQRLADRLDEMSRKLDQLATRNPVPRPARAEPDRAQVYAIQVDGYPSIGSADAKVTLVIARDYACPYCEKSRATLVDLRKKYGGDLRLVYRNFVVHPQLVTAAALAACAAAKQGKFDAIDDALWERGFKTRTFDANKSDPDPRCWETTEGCPVVVGFARDANLKLDRFKADMRSCQVELQADMRELTGFGIGSTPSFFINGRYMVGAMPAESFAALIDEELAKANQRIAAGTPKAAYYKTWVLGKGLARFEAPAAAPAPPGS